MSDFIRIVGTIFAAITIVLPATAQADRPVMSAVKASEQPKIDGDISDQCWKDAQPISDFYYPQDGSKASEPTTAWVCYDKKHIYVAFYSKDSQPGAIVAEQKKRGGSMNSDDRVEINIDGFGSANWSRLMWFQVNPRGTQREVIQSGSASNIEWRGDWEGTSKRVADGYTTEMAIPFSMLHYDPKQPNICIMLSRYHARTRQWWRTPNVGPNLDMKLFYSWQGVEAPDIQKRPLALAYSILGTGQSNRSSTAGCDLKWNLTPQLTGVATYNPDFGNVEQQVGSIDFTYNEAYYPDNRPFFKEGDTYLPGSGLLYTRRINEIDYGGKLVGQLRGYNIGLLQSNQPGSDDFVALKVSRDLKGRGQIAISGVQSQVAGAHNLATQIDGNYTLYKRNERMLDVSSDISIADAASGKGKGQSYGFGLNYSKPNSWGWSIGQRLIDPDYDPILGYVPEKNLRSLTGGVSLSKDLTAGRVEGWGVSLNMDSTDHLDGTKYYDSLGLNASCYWRRGCSTWFGLSTSDRPPYNDNVASFGYGWGDRSLYRNGYLDIAFGKMAGGDYLSYDLSQARDLGNRLNLKVTYQNSRIRSPSESAYSSHQSIATLAYDLNKEQTIAGRFVSRDGKSNLYLTYCQKVRTGMDVYVILGDPNADSTKSILSIKLLRPI